MFGQMNADGILSVKPGCDPLAAAAGSIAPFVVGAAGPDRLLFSALDSLIAERNSSDDWDLNWQRRW